MVADELGGDAQQAWHGMSMNNGVRADNSTSLNVPLHICVYLPRVYAQGGNRHE